MNRPKRPELAAEDDLTGPADIDLNAALAPLLAQQTRSPIVRNSKAEDVAALLERTYPQGEESLQQLAEKLTDAFDRYPRRNTHPGFFGWVAPSNLPSDPLACAMVSALCENVGGYWSSPVGTTIEKTVSRWLADMAGFPAEAEGVILSGGSIANLSGLAAALAHRFGPDYRRQGLNAFSQPSRPVIICSRETHFSIRRAAVMLGIGSDNLITVETDSRFRMRVAKLAEALALHANVVCVVASAGTTNTGAIDPLDEIAEICAQHNIWLHVDAAYGAGGLMSDRLKPRYRGIEKADSLVMDLHKWFYQSPAASLLLYRNAEHARNLFVDSSDYLRAGEDTSPEQYAFFHISPELSRPLRGLPTYIALRRYGLDRLGRNALYNVECTEYLAELIGAEADLQLVVAPQLSILCFRFDPGGTSDDRVDDLNERIREQIQQEGDFLMSPTLVRGRPVLRVCIINHATRATHIEGLVESVLRIGHSLTR